MLVLRRHLLAHLSPAGWAAVLQRPWDDEARECLTYWATQHAPLVVTRQRAGLPPDQLALGLPAPLRWQRRRLALQVPLENVLHFDDFPTAPAVVGLLPAAGRGGWLALAGALADLDAVPRVYGSFGWQHLTGLNYLHADSDLDLQLTVADAASADAVAALLSRADAIGPRVDGELVFPDGSAVAWREWLRWRVRQVDRVLVKRLHGVAMEFGDDWLIEPQSC